MRIIADIRWMAGIVLFLVNVICVAPGEWNAASAAGDDWLGSLMEAVLAEQAKDAPLGGTFTPYLAQLTTVRANLMAGENEGVYRAMNRFMDMLQAREQGIAAEAADRLFDYCYRVTPARYHDVSRHLHRLSGYLAGVLPA